jgi:Alginate lyase
MTARRKYARLAVATAAVGALALGVAGPAAAAPASSPAAGPANTLVPRTVTLDGLQLLASKVRYRIGDPRVTAPMHTLLGHADDMLDAGPWTVTDKPQLPPSNDKHDYLSQAPYWWPSQPKTADNPWGCPYIQRDGIRNPDADAIPDHDARGDAFDAIYTLSLAWFYTGKRAYAERAELDLRTWFLDPATRMNPNLAYTQFVPCAVDGRGIGIIDFSELLPDVIDAVALLDAGAPSWSRTDHAGMTAWFGDFLTWLRTSANGAEEAAAENNHGSFFDEQEAALAAYTGQRALAQQIVRAAEKTRLDKQIAVDGGEPLELSRTRSWHYSIFNLMALTRLAQIGRHVGVDVWHYRNANGATLFDAVDFLIPGATAGASAWTYPELTFRAYGALDVLHAAADAGDRSAARALPAVPAPPGGDQWVVRPAAEQMDLS